LALAVALSRFGVGLPISFSGSRDERRATSFGCRVPLGSTRDRFRSFGGGSLVGVAADSRNHCIPTGGDESGRAGTVACNNNIVGRSSGDSGEQRNLLIVSGSRAPFEPHWAANVFPRKLLSNEGSLAQPTPKARFMQALRV
jgi:hypothetical protein